LFAVARTVARRETRQAETVATIKNVSGGASTHYNGSRGLWVSFDHSQQRAGWNFKSPCTAPSGPCRTQRNGRCLHCLNERTKYEPLCQFCVSWHTLSWSVPAGMAEMAETCSQTKTEFMLIYKAFSRERLVLPDRIELSTSPLPMECLGDKRPLI
jgi:hypothetical protein